MENLSNNKGDKQKNAITINPNLLILGSQLLGTIILSYGIHCTSYTPPLNKKQSNFYHDIFISLSLYLAICLFGSFSGAHCNPSVSLAVYRIKQNKINFKKLMIYFIGQFVGACIGCFLSQLHTDISGVYQQQPQIGLVIEGVCGQFIGTFLFTLFILIVTNKTTTFIYQEYEIDLFIPISLYFSRLFSYHIGGVNPIILITTQIIYLILYPAPAITLVYVIILCISSLLGAFISSVFYRNIFIMNVQASKLN